MPNDSNKKGQNKKRTSQQGASARKTKSEPLRDKISSNKRQSKSARNGS